MPIRNYESPIRRNTHNVEENLPLKKIYINVGHSDMRPSTQGAEIFTERNIDHIIEAQRNLTKVRASRNGLSGQSQTLELDSASPTHAQRALLNGSPNEKK